MGLLILALIGYLVGRRVAPNGTFHAMMTVDSKVLVILLLVATLATGTTSHVPFAEVVVFTLCLLFAITVAGYPQPTDDAPRLFPFLRSFTSRAPPAS
jgi:hypothetical protein